MCDDKQDGSGVAALTSSGIVRGSPVAGDVPAPVVAAPPSQSQPLDGGATEDSSPVVRRDDVETLFLYRRSRFFDVAAEATVKNKPGVVRRVICGSAPAGMNGVLTLRDGASGAGKIIATIAPAVGQAFSVELDAPFEKALSITLAGATPGNFTVVWE